jgi:hypothetical protein
MNVCQLLRIDSMRDMLTCVIDVSSESSLCYSISFDLVIEPSHIRSGLVSSLSAPLIHRSSLSIPSGPTINVSKSLPSTRTDTNHASTVALTASYFDIGIFRILFSPSWSTDGYLWCLEYLHQRLIDISDQVLSVAMATGTSPIDLLRMKSLSMPQIHRTYEYLAKTYLNERITNTVIEQEYRLSRTQTNKNVPNSVQQRTARANLSWRSSYEKRVTARRTHQRYASFYRKIR